MFDKIFNRNNINYSYEIKEKIKEIDNEKDISISLFKGKDLKDFKDKSGELALQNEFQCHYTALVRIEEYEDGSKQYLVFPLIYYNYKQEVGSATINFDMKEVSKIAGDVFEVSKQAFRELKRRLSKFDIDKNISYKMTIFNSIHKHP